MMSMIRNGAAGSGSGDWGEVDLAPSRGRRPARRNNLHFHFEDFSLTAEISSMRHLLFRRPRHES